jgi:hypothetical protein
MFKVRCNKTIRRRSTASITPPRASEEDWTRHRKKLKRLKPRLECRRTTR